MAVSVKKKQVVIRADWCKGCGICVAFCPKSVLRLINGRAVAAKPEQCIGCGMCEMRCPDFAVYLREDESYE